MIRKAFILVVVASLIFWLAGAYLMKRKVGSFIDNIQTDNIQILHSGLNISGFPYSWKVNLSSPKILLIDNHSSIEIGSQDIEIDFSFGLKETQIDLGRNFIFTNLVDQKSAKYSVRASTNLILYANTNRRIYEIDDHKDVFYNVIDHVYIEDPLISILEQEEDTQEAEVFTVKDFAIAMQKQYDGNQDNIFFTLKGRYKSDARFFDFKSSSIDARIKYYFDDTDNSQRDYDRMIDVQKLYVDFDDAFLDSKGAIKLARADVPSGEFTLSMKHYDRIINILIPQDFILSQNYIKKIISKTVMNSGVSRNDEDPIKFEFKFSNEGVSIGNFNLVQNGLE